MAQCKLTPHEFIQNAFSPMVAVMCSSLAEQSCQKNNLSFVELIQPFCKLNTEATIREPSGTSVLVRNLRISMVDINCRPPQPTLARKFLNESVSSSSSEQFSSLQIGSQTIDIPCSVPWFEAWRDTFLQVQFPSDHEFTKHFTSCVIVVSSAESNVNDTLQQMGQQLQQMQNMTPAKLPKWFCPNVLRYYVLLHDSVDSDNETAEAAFNTMKTAYGAANSYLLQINSNPPGHREDQSHLPDPWSQFLIRRIDNQEMSADSSPRTPADVTGVTGMPSRVSAEGAEGDPDSRPSTLEVGQEVGEHAAQQVTVTLHPLSPDAEAADKDKLTVPSHINANVWAGQAISNSGTEHGLCLTSEDLDRIRELIQEFITKALLPYIERQMQQLNDIVSNKKGVSRSLFSATKRWFGGNKPGTPGSNIPVNAVIYASDAPELQLRRLGDLCFMFGNYALAFQAYHSAKRDFNADQAWLYYAGALEMAALAAFMQGEPSRKAQEYMDESILTYLNSCRMPQFATRATLLSTECLKGRNLYGEAAKQFIRMTSEDSDLRSALLLEQASYCFLKATRPRMPRKYAFHIVLAGHRFSKAGQRKHSLRCYRQAYQVYENKNWSLAEDHIHFTIGRQAANLNQVNEAATAFSHLLSLSSRQSTMQQAAFLKEFLTTQKQLQDENMGSDSSLPTLPLPLVDCGHVRVLLGPLPDPPGDALVPASGVGFEDAVDGTAWAKLEEMMVAEALGFPPMIFKPTVQLFTNKTNNSVGPNGVINEPVNVLVKLENPVHIPLALRNVRLLWRFTPTSSPYAPMDDKFASPGPTVDNEFASPGADNAVITQCLESLLIKPDFTQEVVLSVTPRLIGSLNIIGIAYHLTSPVETAAPNHAASSAPAASVAPAVCIPGKQEFALKPQRAKTPNERIGLDARDQRLEINVLPEAPSLEVTFSGLTRTMLGGQLAQVSVTLHNRGACGLRKLLVAWSPAHIALLGPATPRDTGQRNRGHHLAKIALPNAEVLGPGQTHVLPMWLRAPETAGVTRLEMLFYYQSVERYRLPKYRLVRHSWSIEVLPSIALSVTAARSDVISQRSGEEVLNLMVGIRNDSQSADPCPTQVSIVQLSLASKDWSLIDQVVLPQDVRLESQEMVHLMAKAQRLAEGKSIFSNVQMETSLEPLQPVNISPFLDFFNRHVESIELSEHLAHHSQPDVTPNFSGDTNLKEIKTTLKVEATLIVRWKAIVTSSGDKTSTVIGQHHLTVDSVGVVSSSSPAVVIAAAESSGTLKIFGPDAAVSLSGANHDKLTPLGILQKLVTYSVQHTPNVAHDFTKSRLCVVPVRLLLQNCSDSHIIVKVNTMGNNSSTSSKTQLYSPHASSAFRWVSLASAWLEVAPHGRGTLALSAATASPGTYDLGARLDVSARVRGAPDSDAVAQAWRVESALVVADSA